jgi:hypothetical protein
MTTKTKKRYAVAYARVSDPRQATAGRIAMPPGYVKITYGRADRGDGGAVFINHKENVG